MRATILAGALTTFLIGSTTFAAAILTPTKLRCEYRVDPLNIGVEKPRLSWVLKSDKPDERGQKQSAYHLLVASTRDKLNSDQGDLWDTGKVQSDETIHIVYAGKPLASNGRAFWKVRTWNGAGAPSDWSEPAMWGSPLLKPGEWKANWIGYDAPADPFSTPKPDPNLNLDGLKWVWTDEGDATLDAPIGTRYFAMKIALPENAKIDKAVFVAAVDDKLSLTINGRGVGEISSWKQPSKLDIASHLRGGENLIGIEATNGAGPAALVGKFLIWHAGAAAPTVVNLDKTLKFSKEKPKKWEDLGGWPAAKEMGDVGVKPWGKPEIKELVLPPPPMLRKPFAIMKPVKRAVVHASALGLYELRLNGQRVGEDHFTPGWTDYNDRIYYNTYDVTSLLQQRDNVIAALLGDGWYCGYYAFEQRRQIYGKDPRLLMQLDIEYDDGSRESIVTDNSWKCAYGPWREADLLMGTAYDATKEVDGWDKTGFDDSSWQPPVVADAPKAPLQPYPGDPVRVHEQLPAKNITEPSPGVYVFDLGQNMVGWARFKIKADRGQKLTFRFSEMLQNDGTLYTTALRGARVIDHYVAKGGGEETWEPIFTFHGFRYVEITGLKEKPGLDAVTGIVAHNPMPRTGSFECSNELVNQLFHNIIWGQKGNYFEVPTDCPQRDERMGWTGDAQFFIPTASYNFDVAAFFNKWLVDLIQDAQHPDGSFADVAPDILGGHGNVAWGDAGIICPYNIYRQYGDTRIIETHWPAMTRYIQFLTKTAKDHIRVQGAYGDWVNLGGGAKSEVIGTAYYEHVVRLMSQMAAAIGRNDDAARYAKLADEIKAAFIKSFVADDGTILASSQTGYALAFTMDLLPDDRKKAAAEKFIKELERKDWHLATGFIGTPRLLPGLTAAGRSDIAYRIFLTETFPSWLYQVKLGATTMWERWDGWTPEKGFQDPGMNSFNHYAFGSVGEWMYRTVAGIDTDGPGFKKIILKPRPEAGLSYARAAYDSVRGPIASEWKREGDTLNVTFIVPPNTTATAYVMASEASRVTESGKPTKESAGVTFLWMEDGFAVYRLASGTYEFSSKL